MSSITDSADLQDRLISNQLKFFSTIQPIIGIQEKFVTAIQPTIDISSNIAATINVALDSIQYTIDNIQNIAQQYSVTLNNIANKVNRIYFDPLQQIVNNIQYLQNSIQLSVDIPELKYGTLLDSFDNFVDTIKIHEVDYEIKEDIVEIQKSISKPSALTWDQWVTLILAILSFLISCATYIDSKDKHYQEEYLKVVDNINSNLEEIISLKSQK